LVLCKFNYSIKLSLKQAQNSTVFGLFYTIISEIVRLFIPKKSNRPWRGFDETFLWRLLLAFIWFLVPMK